MATIEHLELSNFIKLVHSNLRKQSWQIGPNEAWRSHCNEVETLKKYAAAMQELATKYWEENYKDGSKATSRIKWVYEYCIHYFRNNELLHQRHREEEIAKKISIKLPEKAKQPEDILKLLDVGSCYNPFKEFECFDVLAIDLAPANANVQQCDFLKVNISENLIINENSSIETLRASEYDVIVFSLLLEYLPSPHQRYLCCEKAYSLLKEEGILIIITPDSKHVGANAKIMKSWRCILARIGFSRIKYEKLPYMHCIVFRKSLNKVIAQRWANMYGNENFFDEMVIPQDFNSVDNSEENNSTESDCTSESIKQTCSNKILE